MRIILVLLTPSFKVITYNDCSYKLLQMTTIGSNTIKMKVLTHIREREGDDGSKYYIFDGITAESIITHASISNERHFDKLTIGSFIVLSRYRLNNARSSSGMFVNIDDAMFSLKHCLIMCLVRPHDCSRLNSYFTVCLLQLCQLFGMADDLLGKVIELLCH